MSVFDEMLARLGEKDVPDAEIRQIMEKAVKESGVFVDSPEAQAMLAKIMEVAQAKMGNKDIRMDENVQPLDGFDVALDLAHKGERGGFLGRKQKEVFDKIMDVKNRSTMLKNGNEHDAEYVVSDLLRALACVEPDSPELSVQLLTAEKELFDRRDKYMEDFKGTSSYEHYLFEKIETCNKSARYFGDENVADAYMAIADEAFYKNSGNFARTGFLEKTMHNYRQVAADHPKYALDCLEAAKFAMRTVQKQYTYQPFLQKTARNVAGVYDAIANNPKVDEEIRRQAKMDSDYLKRKYGLDKEAKSTEATAQQQTASKPEKAKRNSKVQEFVNKAKAYAGGAKLFDRIKEAVQKDWQRQVEFLKNNPNKVMGAGAAAMLIGMETANPALAAAGAAIMTYGFCQKKLSSLKNKVSKKEIVADKTATNGQTKATIQNSVLLNNYGVGKGR